MRATDRSDTHDATRERDTRLENFAAELTSAVYALLLRRGLKGSWVHVELSLWRALAETVEKWTREPPPAAAPGESDAWGEGLLADLTERASAIALDNGIDGSLLKLDLLLYRAFRPVLRRQSRGRTPDRP